MLRRISLRRPRGNCHERQLCTGFSRDAAGRAGDSGLAIDLAQFGGFSSAQASFVLVAGCNSLLIQTDSLGIQTSRREFMPQSAVSSRSSYAEFVNPQWVRLLELLDMDVHYERCAGVELFSEDGDRYLDFLSGYCVHNTGHNHPRILQALKDELDRSGPAMLQSHVPELAGELAQRLCKLAGGNLKESLFRQFWERGRRGRHQVFPRGHQTQRASLLRGRVSRPDLRCSVADGQHILAGRIRHAAA